jgi:hypothetical protein
MLQQQLIMGCKSVQAFWWYPVCLQLQGSCWKLMCVLLTQWFELVWIGTEALCLQNFAVLLLLLHHFLFLGTRLPPWLQLCMSCHEQTISMQMICQHIMFMIVCPVRYPIISISAASSLIFFV